MPDPQFEYGVFINCPFDELYRPILEALVFAVHDCGYVARCSLEVTDASQVRIDKIAAIVAACKYGIHDISRTELDKESHLPRFNMPLELGLFLGAKRFGSKRDRSKSCLILDIERYRYQKFISDIAGQDIAAHGGDPDAAIRAVRDWLSAATPRSVKVPGGSAIAHRYRTFRDELPAACKSLHLRPDELTFNDFVVQVEEWLKLNRLAAG